jgi:hypothetical protein
VQLVELKTRHELVILIRHVVFNSASSLIIVMSCGEIVGKLYLTNFRKRVLTFSNFDANANSFLEKLGWDDLNQQRQFQKELMVFKSLNNLAPECLCSKFTNRNNVTPDILRDSVNKLAAPLPRTNYLKNSFSIAIVVQCYGTAYLAI